MLLAAERALQLPDAPRSRWHRAGVTPRTARLVELGGYALVLLLAIGWTWTIARAATATEGEEGDLPASIAAAIHSDRPAAA
jgi:hypothetical protein